MGKTVWGVLQSSNAHVTFEMNTMRRSKRCKSTKVMIAGGDGLSVHRENHNIATDPETFLDMAPAVVQCLAKCRMDITTFYMQRRETILLT